MKTARNPHRVPQLACALALALVALASPAAAKLPSKELRELKKTLSEAVSASKWEEAAEAFKALAKDDTKATFKLMLKTAEKFPMDLSRPLGESLTTFTDEAALAEARKEVGRCKVPLVRRALALGFAERKDYGPLIESLDDKDEDFVYTVITRLVAAKVEAAIEPMLDLAEKKEKDKSSGTWLELQEALAELLGQRCNSPVEYRSLWAALKDQGGLSAAKKLGERVQTGGGDKPKEVGGTQTREFFGRSITSSRVVFILDTSGSMTEKDTPRRGYGGYKGPVTGTDGKPEPPKEIETRLVRAQRELIKVIENLDERVRINVVAYSGLKDVRVWKEGRLTVHPLTPANRQSAKDFVSGFIAAGATATDKALEKAYEIDGARAFYLLSDGSPSHGNGKSLDLEEVYKVVRSHDKGRGITIHTMGFKGAHKEFMTKLAAMTGGRYSEIPLD